MLFHGVRRVGKWGGYMCDSDRSSESRETAEAEKHIRRGKDEVLCQECQTQAMSLLLRITCVVMG